VIGHLLTRCEPCLEHVRRALTPADDELNYGAVMRRLGLSYLVASHRIDEERTQAAEHWQLLRLIDAGHRMQIVRQNGSFQYWALSERVLQEAKLIIKHDPIQAIDLTSLAVLITESLDPAEYDETLINDFRASALIAHANAKRLFGDLSGARAALEEAEEFLSQGTGDPLERTGHISTYASLLTDLGQLEDAERVLEDALMLARSIEDRHLEARITIQQSSTIGWVDPLKGLALSERGLALLDQSGTDDAFLKLCAIHLFALWTNEAGDSAAARSTFEAYRFLYQQFNDVFWRGRLLHLQGYIARSQGDYSLAERMFRELVDLYSVNNFEFDLALAVIDLCEVLALQGRALESGESLSALYPVLRQWNVNGEILRQWAMLKDAMMVRRHTLGAFRELSMLVRRKWFRRETV
jgi:tetratricopeptide (TPR) repeat protein